MEVVGRWLLGLMLLFRELVQRGVDFGEALLEGAKVCPPRRRPSLISSATEWRVMLDPSVTTFASNLEPGVPLAFR